jgi:hypothetical protein
MDHFKSLILSICCLGLLSTNLVNAGPREDALKTVKETAGSMAYNSLKTGGRLLSTIASKTFGWGFGLTQTALGGGIFALGGVCAYTLYNAHTRNELDVSNKKGKENLMLLAGTAVALPVGFVLMSKGLRNIWNA